jgi:hypothetical protein
LQGTGQIGRTQAGGDGWLVKADGRTEIESEDEQERTRRTSYSNRFSVEQNTDRSTLLGLKFLILFLKIFQSGCFSVKKIRKNRESQN